MRAIAAEPAEMVGIAVTAAAGTARILEGLGLVAFLAGNHRVQTEQGKACQVVVKSDLLMPTGLLVTLPAIVPQLPAVRIVLVVTGNARRRQLVAIQIARVAALARELGVATAQWKSCGRIVIETYLRPFSW
jgi:hypothetical protein